MIAPIVANQGGFAVRRNSGRVRSTMVRIRGDPVADRRVESRAFSLRKRSGQLSEDALAGSATEEAEDWRLILAIYLGS